MPTCCISGENHPVDPVHPVQSSDQTGSRPFSHMWSSPCLRGEFPTAAYFCDAHTTQGVAEEVVDPDDLKSPEWKVFSNPTQAKELTDKSRNPLMTLAKSTELWERRIAIIATQHFIRRGEFRDTLKISQTLLSDTEDLIHKATGWMLREVGKRHEPTLTTFLEQHGTVMPRTMLRYAMERLSPKQRQEFLLRK